MNVSWRLKRTAIATVMGAIAVAALTLGCGSGGATKAGKKSGPVILRAVWSESNVAAIDYFQRRVSQLSGGALQIEKDDALNDGTTDSEKHMVRYTARGTADLAWIRTFGLDVLGVKSFQALTDPLLVDSYPLQGAVIASGITDEMLPGLGRLGVTGLAVFAGSFRKPEAVKHPLLGPADWRGIIVQMPPSNAIVDAFRTLGARPLVAGHNDLATLASEGKLQGVEKTLPVYQEIGFDSVVPYVTANVNLWPSMYALIANPKRLSKLTADEQKWLRQAAADAASHSASVANHQDVSTVKSLCEPGRATRFAEASVAELSALRAAFAPATARLERDTQTKAFIGRIEQLKRSTGGGPPLAIPTRCKAPGRKSAVVSISKNASGVLNGIYRVSYTKKELLANGAAAGWVKYNYGTGTLSLKDGHYRFHLVNYAPSDCYGPYTVSGQNVRFDLNVPFCTGSVVATWALSNGQLRLRVTNGDGGDEVYWGSKPWKKIG